MKEKAEGKEKANERVKAKVKGRGKGGTMKLMSSFVVLAVVLSVLATSIATVSSDGPPPPTPEVTKIEVTASPKSIPADGSSTSTITATVTDWTGAGPGNFSISFTIISQPEGASLPSDPVIVKTDDEGNASTTLTAGTMPGEVVVKAYATFNESAFDYVTITLTGPPKIVDYAPESPVKDNEGATRTFSITVDQPASVTWRINGTVKQTNESVPAYTPCNYTNESAVAGVWNVTAFVENPNGTAMQTWIWRVSGLERIEVSPSEATLQVGNKMQFNATAYDQFNEIMPGIIFAWSSSNTTVGAVDQTGRFTAKAPGETFVNATNQSVVGSAHVVVTPGPLARIVVTPSEKELNMSERCQFEAKGYDDYDNEIPGLTFTWTSSNETVGTVNGTGYFEALYPGFTFVNATADGVTGTASVTVTYVPEVKTVVVSPGEVTLNITEEQQFTATAYDQLGKEMVGVEFTWSSSNETVGTVDANGLFTAKYPGFTFVNATAPNGVKGTASVTVTYTPEVTTIVIDPAEVSIYEGDTQEFTATAYDQLGKEMPGITDFAWSSSNTTVGTVSPSTGKTTVFTALKAGDTMVIAMTAGVSNTSAVHVLPRPDLVVEEIMPNPDCGGYLFANESNEICAVIKNNGSGDALSFNVSFSAGLDGLLIDKVRVGGLAAGEDMEVCVNDTATRPAGETVPISVFADCDDEISELNETNNENSTEETVVNNGYKGKSFAGVPSLVLLEHDKFNGSIVYTVGNSTKVELEPANTTTTGFDIAIPEGATVRTARLYVYWYDSWYSAVHGDADLEVTFNGHSFTTPGASYTDSKGFGSYNYPRGTYAYDVTSAVSGTGTYTATIENKATNTNTVLTGQLLLVVYEDANETEMEYWITEGCDLLKADSNYCVSPAEAIANVTITDTIDVTNKSARLITVVAQGNEPGTDLSFNEQVWEDVWQTPEGSSKINIDDRSVTSWLKPSDNVVDFRDTGTKGMQASNAILVVRTTMVIPLPDGSLPADPDGDGLYEDVNGNGRKDFDDVVKFFTYMEWIADNEPISCFDFNGNGRIDFDDVVKLFEEI